MTLRCSLSLWALVVFAPGAPLFAAVLNVPSASYPTIQSAINAAVHGDQVVVAPGTYYERISFCGKNITVRSANPADAAIVAGTIIDGSGAGTVVTLNHSETAGASLQGLTIRNGSALLGGGIYCNGTSPVLQYNVITANTAVNGGGGIYCVGAGTPTIAYNTITGNTATSPTQAKGGGIYSASAASITGNTISGNSSALAAGGVWLSSAASSLVSNTITGNWAPTGGGVFVYGCSPTISLNQIRQNTASLAGGGMEWEYGSPSGYGNLIVGNSGGTWGGGLRAIGSSATIRGYSFSGNSAAGNAVLAGGGGIFSQASALTIADCIIALQTRGGGVVLGGGTAPAVSYCNVWSNSGGEYVGFTPTGTGNLSVDPLFADATGMGDCHLRSKVGRWTGSGWVVDSVHSPCIDAASPSSAWTSEPTPNGARANMGAYGNTVEASKSYTPPGPYQPDMLIRVAGLTWQGDNVYNTTAADQTATTTQLPGVTVRFQLQLQNDGTNADTFVVTGWAGNAALTVRYFDSEAGGADITSQVTSTTGWRIGPLESGACRDFRAEVTATEASMGNSFRYILVTARSVGGGTVRDVVKGVLWTAPIRRPDGWVRVRGEGSYVGNGIYNTSGADQTRTATAGTGVTRVYEIVLENDGNLSDQFRVTGTAGGAGWTVRYFDAHSGGTDITWAMTHATWLTKPTARGATRLLRAEVVPDSTVVVGAQKEITVTATSAYDSSVSDVVKGITTKE